MTVADLNVTVNITHSYDNDLSMWLVDPTSGISVYLASSVGGDVGTLVSWSMAITPLTTYQSTDVPHTIPDMGTLNSTLTVPYSLAIQDVNVRLSVAHTYDSDLTFWLVNPSGTLTVQLVSKVGGDGDNFTNTVFDDSAATAIGSGAAPFTGTYRPVGSLAQFNGTDAGGTWTLRASDQVGGDVGSLTSWSLDFVGDVTTPEPSMLAALASGLLLLAALGRKLRS